MDFTLEEIAWFRRPLRGLAFVAALALAACAVDERPPPACAAVGCPDRPSGSPLRWEPCAAGAGTCWCNVPAEACAPAAIPVPDAEACFEITGPGSEEYQAACGDYGDYAVVRPYACPVGHDGGPEEDGLSCFVTTYRGRHVDCCAVQP